MHKTKGFCGRGGGKTLIFNPVFPRRRAIFADLFPYPDRMTLLDVGDNPALRREFLHLPLRLYRDQPTWIRPLDKDIEEVFDLAKNPSFQHGEAIRWVLQNDAGQTIGRVAAFVDYEKAAQEEQPTGGMGFFECIDDEAAATRLFEACREWLTGKGMEAMDGPVNFGERDTWWGLLVDGFQYEPTYKMPWTLPYYQRLFEGYGFQDYFRQFTYVTPIRAAVVTPGVEERARRIYNNPAYQFRHVEKSDWKTYAAAIRTIYNKAWVRHSGVKPMTEEKAEEIVKAALPILDEQLIWFAYAGEEPVAFFIVLPEINQLVKYLDGQFNLWAKLKFLLLKTRGVVDKTFGVSFGVVPEHQGKGLESAIALRFRQAGRDDPEFPYQTIEMNWVGDFNPIMLRFVRQIGGELAKTYVTYRYLFDREKPFKRCPVIR